MGQNAGAWFPTAGSTMVSSAQGRNLAALSDIRFQGFLVLANCLLRLPGHALRLATLRRLCLVRVGEQSSIERGVRVTARGGGVVGADRNINEDVVLDGRRKLTIGDLVSVV